MIYKSDAELKTMPDAVLLELIMHQLAEYLIIASKTKRFGPLSKDPNRSTAKSNVESLVRESIYTHMLVKLYAQRNGVKYGDVLTALNVDLEEAKRGLKNG